MTYYGSDEQRARQDPNSPNLRTQKAYRDGVYGSTRPGAPSHGPDVDYVSGYWRFMSGPSAGTPVRCSNPKCNLPATFKLVSQGPKGHMRTWFKCSHHRQVWLDKTKQTNANNNTNKER